MNVKRIIVLAVIVFFATSCVFEQRGQMLVIFAVRNQTGETLAFETNCDSFLQEYNPYSGLSVESVGEIKDKYSAFIASNRLPAMSNKNFLKQERGPYSIKIEDLVQNMNDAEISIFAIKDGEKRLLKTWYAADYKEGGVQLFDINQCSIPDVVIPDFSFYVDEIIFYFELTRENLGLDQ